MADITGILLAAGFSRRFGRNKLTMPMAHSTVIEHSAAALAPCDRIVVVLRSGQQQMRTILQRQGIDIVINPAAERGIGASIACAVGAAVDSDGWCILPADMPYLQQRSTGEIVNALRAGAALAALLYQGQRGHPVGFSSAYLDALLALDGDSGARHILQQHADRVTCIDSDDVGIIRDIDYRQDLHTVAAYNDST